VRSLRRVWCCGCCRRAVRGVADAVAVPRWCRGRGRRFLHGVWVGVGVVTPRGCRSCARCAACGVTAVVAALRVGRTRCFCVCGVAVALVAPHVVSWPRSLCGMWVALAIFARCVGRGRGQGRRTVWVSRSRSLHGVWCRGRGRCAAHGSRSPFLRSVWCRHRRRRAVWCCGHGGRRRATWCRCRSCGYRRHVVTGLQKRKLVEKRKKTY
jgi:hypothetical protein